MSLLSHVALSMRLSSISSGIPRRTKFSLGSFRWASKLAAKGGGNNDEKVLVIVESPAKARTIQKIVGENSDKFIIDSCAGHIRDLASGLKDFPAKFQPTPVFAPLHIRNTDLGVEVFDNFKPYYVPIKGKNEIIRRLQEKAKKVDRILLATDEDREGESISWHLVEVLKPKVPFQVQYLHPFFSDKNKFFFKENLSDILLFRELYFTRLRKLR